MTVKLSKTPGKPHYMGIAIAVADNYYFPCQNAQAQRPVGRTYWPSAVISRFGRALRMDNAMTTDVSAYTAATAPSPVRIDSAIVALSNDRTPCAAYTPTTAPTAAGSSIAQAFCARVALIALCQLIPHINNTPYLRLFRA